jgi:branched-chain amino acid transport system permease protein
VDQFLQHLVNAAVLGGTYALLGIGLTLIFGIMRVVNFTHGELYAFGAYTVYLVAAALGLNFFLGLVVRFAGALLGALIEDRAAAADARRRYRYRDAGDDRRWIVMQNTELWSGAAWPSRSSRPFPDAPLVIGPVSISWLAGVRARQPRCC